MKNRRKVCVGIQWTTELWHGGCYCTELLIVDNRRMVCVGSQWTTYILYGGCYFTELLIVKMLSRFSSLLEES